MGGDLLMPVETAGEAFCQDSRSPAFRAAMPYQSGV